jgi:two-component system sensor histidine kinase QseC
MKVFSLRRRLTALILGSLLALWLAMLALGYYGAREEVDELADARLRETVRILMLLDLRRLDALAAEPGHGAGDDGRGHEMRLSFQLHDRNGRLLLRAPDAPDASYDPRDGYATLRHDGAAWRTYALRSRAGYQVRAFEPLAARAEITRKAAWRMAQPLLLSLPLLALLVWSATGSGLKPLDALSKALALRNADQLEPVSLALAPAEAQPLLQSLNALLERLARSIERERAFTADAAHALRTPMAAIKVQAEVALAARDDAERRHALDQVVAGVDRATRLAQQLLALARLDHAAAGPGQLLDLGALAAASAAVHAEAAVRKEIELEVEARPGCMLVADQVALSVLLDNLLDNAVKYGRRGGHVTVRVSRDGERIALAVCDDGPGVPEESRAGLARRFYRVPGSPAEGSGLGLAIVENVARNWGGELRFGEGLHGRGLGVTVSFPAASQAADAAAQALV